MYGVREVQALILVLEDRFLGVGLLSSEQVSKLKHSHILHWRKNDCIVIFVKLCVKNGGFIASVESKGLSYKIGGGVYNEVRARVSHYSSSLCSCNCDSWPKRAHTV